MEVSREFNLDSKYSTDRFDSTVIIGKLDYRKITQTFKLTMVDGVEKAREFMKEDSTNWSLYGNLQACHGYRHKPWQSVIMR